MGTLPRVRGSRLAVLLVGLTMPACATRELAPPPPVPPAPSASLGRPRTPAAALGQPRPLEGAAAVLPQQPQARPEPLLAPPAPADTIYTAAPAWWDSGSPVGSGEGWPGEAAWQPVWRDWKGQAGACSRETCTYFRDWAGRVWQDQGNYYAWPNLACLGVGIAVAAPLANTAADQEIQSWYQDHVRSQGTDDLASVVKPFGDFGYVAPASVAAMLVGSWTRDTAAGSAVAEWGSRTSRALLAGAPTVGILQVVLGAHRPDEGSSYWRPFQDNNGVSGHAFVGAVPFLSAARMTENRLARASLVAASVLPAWSRINDNAHYLSQAALGWWVGYLAVQSVDRTETERALQVLPFCPGAEGVGASVLLRY